MTNQDRLLNLKELLRLEYASKKPSQLYIDDLEQSIIELEKQMKNNKPYEMVMK